MNIKYLGPSPEVNVASYGPHRKDAVKEYPDDFAEELLATSKKQKFELVHDDTGEEVEVALDESAPVVDLNEWTVKQLTVELEERGIEIPKKARKAELIALLN